MQAAGSPPADLVGDMNAAQEALGDLDTDCAQQWQGWHVDKRAMMCTARCTRHGYSNKHAELRRNSTSPTYPIHAIFSGAYTGRTSQSDFTESH